MRSARFVLSIMIVSTLAFPGCKKFNVPKGFPSPKEMAQIIADLHVVESAMNYGVSYHHSPERYNSGYYRDVLAKHGLSSEKFDTIRSWYIQNPAIYQHVYDQVIVILSKREAEVRILNQRKKELELRELAELMKRPSNLWQGPTSFVVKITDTIDKRLPFVIKTDTLEISGRLNLSASYKFLREDVSRSPRMMLAVFYNDSTADTIYQAIPHSFRSKSAALELQLNNELKPLKVHGYLLLQDPPFTASVEVNNVSLRVIKDTINLKPSSDTLKLEKSLQ